MAALQQTKSETPEVKQTQQSESKKKINHVKPSEKKKSFLKKFKKLFSFRKIFHSPQCDSLERPLQNEERVVYNTDFTAYTLYDNNNSLTGATDETSKSEVAKPPMQKKLKKKKNRKVQAFTETEDENKINSDITTGKLGQKSSADYDICIQPLTHSSGATSCSFTTEKDSEYCRETCLKEGIEPKKLKKELEKLEKQAKKDEKLKKMSMGETRKKSDDVTSKASLPFFRSKSKIAGRRLFYGCSDEHQEEPCSRHHNTFDFMNPVMILSCQSCHDSIHSIKSANKPPTKKKSICNIIHPCRKSSNQETVSRSSTFACKHMCDELLKQSMLCNQDTECCCKFKTFLITTEVLEYLFQKYMSSQPLQSSLSNTCCPPSNNSAYTSTTDLPPPPPPAMIPPPPMIPSPPPPFPPSPVAVRSSNKSLTQIVPGTSFERICSKTRDITCNKRMCRRCHTIKEDPPSTSWFTCVPKSDCFSRAGRNSSHVLKDTTGSNFFVVNNSVKCENSPTKKNAIVLTPIFNDDTVDAEYSSERDNTLCKPCRDNSIISGNYTSKENITLRRPSKNNSIKGGNVIRKKSVGNNFCLKKNKTFKEACTCTCKCEKFTLTKSVSVGDSEHIFLAKNDSIKNRSVSLKKNAGRGGNMSLKKNANFGETSSIANGTFFREKNATVLTSHGSNDSSIGENISGTKSTLFPKSYSDTFTYVNLSEKKNLRLPKMLFEGEEKDNIKDGSYFGNKDSPIANKFIDNYNNTDEDSITADDKANEGGKVEKVFEKEWDHSNCYECCSKHGKGRYRRTSGDSNQNLSYNSIFHVTKNSQAKGAQPDYTKQRKSKNIVYKKVSKNNLQSHFSLSNIATTRSTSRSDSNAESNSSAFSIDSLNLEIKPSFRPATFSTNKNETVNVALTSNSESVFFPSENQFNYQTTNSTPITPIAEIDVPKLYPDSSSEEANNELIEFALVLEVLSKLEELPDEPVRLIIKPEYEAKVNKEVKMSNGKSMNFSHDYYNFIDELLSGNTDFSEITYKIYTEPMDQSTTNIFDNVKVINMPTFNARNFVAQCSHCHADSHQRCKHADKASQFCTESKTNNVQQKNKESNIKKHYVNCVRATNAIKKFVTSTTSTSQFVSEMIDTQTPDKNISNPTRSTKMNIPLNVTGLYTRPNSHPQLGMFEVVIDPKSDLAKYIKAPLLQRSAINQKLSRNFEATKLKHLKLTPLLAPYRNENPNCSLETLRIAKRLSTCSEVPESELKVANHEKLNSTPVRSNYKAELNLLAQDQILEVGPTILEEPSDYLKRSNSDVLEVAKKLYGHMSCVLNSQEINQTSSSHTGTTNSNFDIYSETPSGLFSQIKTSGLITPDPLPSDQVLFEYLQQIESDVVDMDEAICKQHHSVVNSPTKNNLKNYSDYFTTAVPLKIPNSSPKSRRLTCQNVLCWSTVSQIASSLIDDKKVSSTQFPYTNSENPRTTSDVSKVISINLARRVNSKQSTSTDSSESRLESATQTESSNPRLFKYFEETSADIPTKMLFSQLSEKYESSCSISEKSKLCDIIITELIYGYLTSLLNPKEISPTETEHFPDEANRENSVALNKSKATCQTSLEPMEEIETNNQHKKQSTIPHAQNTAKEDLKNEEDKRRPKRFKEPEAIRQDQHPLDLGMFWSPFSLNRKKNTTNFLNYTEMPWVPSPPAVSSDLVSNDPESIKVIKEKSSKKLENDESIIMDEIESTDEFYLPVVDHSDERPSLSPTSSEMPNSETFLEFAKDNTSKKVAAPMQNDIVGRFEQPEHDLSNKVEKRPSLVVGPTTLTEGRSNGSPEHSICFDIPMIIPPKNSSTKPRMGLPPPTLRCKKMQRIVPNVRHDNVMDRLSSRAVEEHSSGVLLQAGKQIPPANLEAVTNCSVVCSPTASNDNQTCIHISEGSVPVGALLKEENDNRKITWNLRLFL